MLLFYGMNADMDLQIWNALNKRTAAQRAYLQGNIRQ